VGEKEGDVEDLDPGNSRLLLGTLTAAMINKIAENLFILRR
jgi:hypothetical protein